MPTLEAGRELDALVAEKVMGMHNAGDDPGLQWGFQGPMWRDAADRYAWQRLPEFSSDIAAAFAVFDRFHHYVIAKEKDGGARCTVVAHDSRYHSHTARATTVPLAICRAALMAVEAANSPSASVH